jgi:uncharacterized protein
MSKTSSGKIWIDLDNSPHVLFFNPVIKELEKKGIQVLITARDFAQVLELLKLFNIKARVIGRHYGKNSILKLIGIIIRSFQLLPVVLKFKPDFAVSHGSRAQFLTSKILGIKVGVALDYEFIQMFPLLKADIVIAPKMIDEKKINLGHKQFFHYNGIKEDVYVPSFEPANRKSDLFNFDKDTIIITIRPPAVLAHYYSEKSGQLFDFLLKHLSSQDGIKIIFTPRTTQQAVELKSKWQNEFNIGKFIIPDVVINGLDLIYNSDLVISGGGTMIREAAALGVPAYSTFGSQIGSVDNYLQKEGKLTILQNEEDVRNKIKIEKRKKVQKDITNNQNVLKELTSKIIELT